MEPKRRGHLALRDGYVDLERPFAAQFGLCFADFDDLQIAAVAVRSQTQGQPEGNSNKRTPIPENMAHVAHDHSFPRTRMARRTSGPLHESPTSAITRWLQLLADSGR